MKCKDCNCCKMGWFESKPKAYVCTGVKEPFVISDINVECTEYPENRNPCISTIKVKYAILDEPKPAKAYVGDDGIYVPSRYDHRYHELLISKELFVEAYNKWIKNDSTSKYDSLFCGKYDTDCWCDD